MTGHPPELQNAIDRHRLGHLDEAEAVYRTFTECHPELAEPWHLLGVVALQRGQAKIAEPFFREALKREPGHVKCLSNLGGALHQMSRHAEAETYLRAALELDPTYVNALHNLGNTALALGNARQAAEYFQKAVTLNPDFLESAVNLAEALKRQGKPDEAIERLQALYEAHPEYRLGHLALIDLLNDHAPKTEPSGPLARAQERLQKVRLERFDAAPINDEKVRALVQLYRDALNDADVSPSASWTQIWRGVNDDPGCDRHKLVFEKFNAIPAYCFGCYKIPITVTTVVDLFKLLIVFETSDLPNDNTRKCFVEIRPNIKGAYKGLIYCESLAEAKELAPRIQTVLDDKIGNGATTAIKRGCSEFPLAHPAYAHFDDGDPQGMTYNEAWRKYEDLVDETMIGAKQPLIFATHNHTGVTLKDAAIMNNWLAYAAAIGDDSYIQIAGTDVPKLQVPPRAPFKATP
jgi:Tfp pilus assembly protein PilF